MYYLVGSGAGIVVMIFLIIIIVVYKIKVYYRPRYLQLMSPEEQFSTSGKQINTIIRKTNESIKFVNFTTTCKYFSSYHGTL